MAINLKAPELKELRPRITVLGVGGAGGNAVNNMIAAKLEGVEFVVANTDAQALAQSKAERKIQLGALTTEGLGAGASPDVGRAGAEESLDEIMEQLAGSHMVFITAGMGGGTGTGAAPVIARAVREMGILVVGVVTKPFAFEGDKRMRIAERGILELQQYVHTLIVIPNQNLFRVANDRTTFAQAFAMADEVLHAGVRGVTDLIVMPGLINLDFADIKSVISEMGKAMMGTGEAEGEGSRAEGRRHGDLQPAARRCLDEGRARRAHQHHRRAGPDAVRGRTGGQPHPRRSRSRRQHHLRQHHPGRHGRPHPRLGRRHRHRCRTAAHAGQGPAAASAPQTGSAEAGAQARTAVRTAPAAAPTPCIASMKPSPTSWALRCRRAPHRRPKP